MYFRNIVGQVQFLACCYVLPQWAVGHSIAQNVLFGGHPPQVEIRFIIIVLSNCMMCPVQNKHAVCGFVVFVWGVVAGGA